MAKTNIFAKETWGRFLCSVYRPRFVFPLLGVISFLVFFQYSAFITWDAAHYLSYLPILDGTAPMSEWDVVRGPVFPVYLWLITKVFGMSANAVIPLHDGLLIVLFLVYTATLYLYYRIIISVLPVHSETKKTNAMILVYVLIGLNPIVFSYFHIALTEHLAAFVTALVILASVKYYRYLAPVMTAGDSGLGAKMTQSGAKYRICLLVLIISCPVLYFLRQNYLMIVLGAALAIILLMILNKRGAKNILRAVRLLCYMLAVLAVSITAWNALLPDIDDEDEYMQSRTSQQIFKSMLIPSKTHYIKYTDDAGGMIVSYYNGKDELVDSYVAQGVERWVDMTLTDAAGVLFRNISRHPVLYIRGIVDAYLALTNFYYPFDSSALSVVKEPSVFRAAENNFVGYYIFWPNVRTNVHAMTPELYYHAQPFEGFRAPNVTINNAFRYMQTLTNFTFTFGLLLLPFCAIAAVILTARYKKDKAFAVSLVTSWAAFGYLLLNSIGQAHIDRYAFPVYIPAWIAIFSMGYGVWAVMKVGGQSKCNL